MAYDKKFLQLALDLAGENVRENRGGPFSALVVKDGNVIGQGSNSVTTNNDPSAHAEIMAIRQACQKLENFELSDCEIYTSCEPCTMCLGAIYWSRPKAVYFAADKNDAARIGFDDAFIYEEIQKDFSARKILFKKFDDLDSLKPFEEWSKSPNKIEY